MTRLIDITGKRFGRWIVLSRAPNKQNRFACWLCRCECGREKIVYGYNLRSGASRQCRLCGSTTHRLSRTRLYRIWSDMIGRCENPNRPPYKRYGGRGIKVCSEWRNDFMAFRKWALEHGYKNDLSIDRIDNDGDYEPLNCQLITRGENSLKGWYIDGSHGKKHLKAS